MIRRIFMTLCLALASTLTAGGQLNADIILSYGADEGGTLYIDLLADTPNQTVLLFASGVAAEGGSDGFELDVQIGDGGAIFDGTDTSPKITSIDLITGTIWEAHGPTQSDNEDSPLARQSTVDTTSLATTDGLVATLVIDTTGFGVGEIEFLLNDVGGEFDTTFFQGIDTLPTTAPNGIIRVTAVPEPSSLAVLGLGLASCLVRRRW